MDFPVYTHNDGQQIQLYMSRRCIDKMLTADGYKKPSDDPRIKNAPDAYAKVLVPKKPEEGQGEGYWDIRFRIKFEKDGTAIIEKDRRQYGSDSRSDWHIGTTREILDAEFEAQHPDASLAAATDEAAHIDPDLLAKHDDIKLAPFVEKSRTDDGSIRSDVAAFQADFTRLDKDKHKDSLAPQDKEAVALLEKFCNREINIRRKDGHRYSLAGAYQGLREFIINKAVNPSIDIPKPEHVGIDSRPKIDAADSRGSEGRRPQPEHHRRRMRTHELKRIADGELDEDGLSHAQRAKASKSKGGRGRGGDSDGE